MKSVARMLLMLKAIKFSVGFQWNIYIPRWNFRSNIYVVIDILCSVNRNEIFMKKHGKKKVWRLGLMKINGT